MKEATLERLRELTKKPVPAPRAARSPVVGETSKAYEERRADLGKLAREDGDGHELMMILETLGNRDDDPDHPLVGNIETLNAMVAQLAG